MQKLVITEKKQSLASSLDAMIAEKKAEQAYSLLLCDVSASMGERVGRVRKIDTLAETINKLAHEKQCRLISFSASAKNVQKLTPTPRSSTNLAAALRLAASHKDARQVIVISDGLPDSETDALTEVQRITVPVSCIYIGPGGDRGQVFLQELARIGRGKSAYTGQDMQKLNKALLLMLPSSRRPE